MRKFFAVILVMMIAVCMAATAYAVTPSVSVPNVKIPSIKIPEIKISDSFWEKWFKDHPIVIPKPTTPLEPTEPEPTEPIPTEPETTELGVPKIKNAHYTHGRAAYSDSNLSIEWTEVEGAESYEVLITLANGDTITYVETDTHVYDTDVQCPQSYSGENGHIAYVKVRAMTGDIHGEWSEEDTISCNAFHF